MRHIPALVALAVLVSTQSSWAYKKGESEKADAPPTRAQLLERRSSLADGMGGWTAMSRAAGPDFSSLTERLEALGKQLRSFEPGKDLRSASEALDGKRAELDALKLELLDRLYAAQSAGKKLEHASPEERALFAALTERKADAFLESASKPFTPGPELAALQGLIAQADSPEALNRAFDRSGSFSLLAPAGDVAQARAFAGPAIVAAEASAPAPRRAPARYSGSEPVSAPRAPVMSAPAGSVARAASHSAPSPAPGGAAPLEGQQSKSGKQSWQREVLKRTGAWGLLAAVGVDPERFLASLTGAESGYATNATSSAGAAGVMQVMPDTARGIMSGRKYREIAREYGLTVYDARNMSNDAIRRMLNRDWRTNILLGILYIEDQARSFGGYVRNLGVSINDKAKLMMNMVAGAYNAGPGRVWNALKSLRRNGLWLDDVNPAQSLVKIRETKNYVAKIIKDYFW